MNINNEQLKKLKRWSKTELAKVSASNSSGLEPIEHMLKTMEQDVWSRFLKRIEYLLHQK
jgi:hypothetical protein